MIFQDVQARKEIKHGLCQVLQDIIFDLVKISHLSSYLPRIAFVAPFAKLY